MGNGGRGKSNHESYQKHLNQAKNNFHFLSRVEDKLPEMFYDWKITVTFYTALHLIRAFTESKGQKLPENHVDVLKCIDPRNKNNNFPLVVNKGCYFCFSDLYNNSMDARYSGFLETSKRRKYLKKKYKESKSALKVIKQYLIKRGLPSDCLELNDDD